MIRIPTCFFCENYIDHVETGKKDKYGRDEIKYTCKAFPEGIPHLKKTRDTEECANGICFKEMDHGNI